MDPGQATASRSEQSAAPSGPKPRSSALRIGYQREQQYPYPRHAGEEPGVIQWLAKETGLKPKMKFSSEHQLVSIDGSPLFRKDSVPNKNPTALANHADQFEIELTSKGKTAGAKGLANPKARALADPKQPLEDSKEGIQIGYAKAKGKGSKDQVLGGQPQGKGKEVIGKAVSSANTTDLFNQALQDAAGPGARYAGGPAVSRSTRQRLETSVRESVSHDAAAVEKVGDQADRNGHKAALAMAQKEVAEKATKVGAEKLVTVLGSGKIEDGKFVEGSHFAESTAAKPTISGSAQSLSNNVVNIARSANKLSENNPNEPGMPHTGARVASGSHTMGTYNPGRNHKRAGSEGKLLSFSVAAQGQPQPQQAQKNDGPLLSMKPAA